MLAAMALESGDAETAIQLYDSAIARWPDRAEPYYKRGNASSRLGRVDRAVADYDRAIGLDPASIDTMLSIPMPTPPETPVPNQYALIAHLEDAGLADAPFRELAITAYDSADPDLCASFDGLCDMLTSILLAIRDAMTETKREETRIRLAEQATDWLKPLVIRAGGVINGGDDAAADARPQNDVDQIMSA